MSGSFAIQGISMSTYGPVSYEEPSYQNLLVGARMDGANYVELSNDVTIDLATGTISDRIINGSDATTKFSDIGPAIAAAEAQGLNVMLKPQVAAYDPALLSFTGSDYGNLTDPNLVISNPAAFFAGYKAYILQWAELAQQYHVPLLSIGNEMLAATKPQYTAYWDDIIASIRQVYGGQLTYSALLPLQTSFDAGNEVKQIQFWDKLDFAGFDVYPSLTNQLDPTISQLDAAWQSNVINGQAQSYVQSITQLAASIGKPVLFTETGVASFPGANDQWDYPPTPIIGQPTTQSDYAAQANWWESFFDTWAVNTPSWLSGIFIWDNDPGVPAGSVYDLNGFNINGKPAELVVSSWFGGKDYLSLNQSSFTGSVANDPIYLYSNAVPITTGKPVSEPQTFATSISLTIDGNIINGQTQTVHFYVNGIDEGAHTLQNTPGTFVDQHGITWSAPQTFTLTLDGLVNINNLKVAIDGPVNIGGVENSQTFISSVTVDGVSLTQGAYFPLQGPSQQLTITSGGQFDGGYEVIDASLWNSQLASRQTGSAADPIQVNGGGGADAVHVLGLPSQYTIDGIGTSTVTLSEHSGLDQNAILTDISYVAFQDGSVLALAKGTWSPGSQPLIAAPAAAVEGSMYNAVGSSAEISNLMVKFLPPQETTATSYGLNALVYGCEVLGLAFAFGNENGSTAFDNNFGPANPSMPSTVTGDSAFAAAASSAIFGSTSTTNLVNVLEGFVSSWKAFYSNAGIPGIASPTATQIDLAARGAAWGDMVGVALANNLGPLSIEVNNFLNDVFAGTAIYSAPLTSQPMTSMIGVSPPSDFHLM